MSAPAAAAAAPPGRARTFGFEIARSARLPPPPPQFTHGGWLRGRESRDERAEKREADVGLYQHTSL